LYFARKQKYNIFEANQTHSKKQAGFSVTYKDTGSSNSLFLYSFPLYLGLQTLLEAQKNTPFVSESKLLGLSLKNKILLLNEKSTLKKTNLSETLNRVFRNSFFRQAAGRRQCTGLSQKIRIL